jgi:hypothetical protein
MARMLALLHRPGAPHRVPGAEGEPRAVLETPPPTGWREDWSESSGFWRGEQIDQSWAADEESRKPPSAITHERASFCDNHGRYGGLGGEDASPLVGRGWGAAAERANRGGFDRGMSLSFAPYLPRDPEFEQRVWDLRRDYEIGRRGPRRVRVPHRPADPGAWAHQGPPPRDEGPWAAREHPRTESERWRVFEQFERAEAQWRERVREQDLDRVHRAGSEWDREHERGRR